MIDSMGSSRSQWVRSGRELLADAAADVTYAARTLRRAPGLTLVAILSLGLGIGITTLVFSVVHALVLEPIDAADPEELYFVEAAHRSYPSISFPNYRDLRDASTTSSALFAYRIAPMTLVIDGAVTRAWGYLATGNYFETLGVKPVLGRVFTAREDVAGAEPVLVLSYDYWQNRFGGDPRVVGREIRINRLPFTVIGVAPRSFHGTDRFYRADAWAPLSMQAQVSGGRSWLESRSASNLWVLTRLKPGVSRAQAEADLNAISLELARHHPETNANMRVRLVEPGLMGSSLRGSVRSFGFGVLLLAGLVMLTACANLASTLAARGADRQREIAIRVSVGAGRGRVLRQLMVESLVLAAFGGAAGCLLAVNAANALSAWRLSIGFPAQVDVAADIDVLLFALAISLAAGVLVGLVPARQASQVEPYAALKSGSARRIGAGSPLRDVLVTVQVAVCCVLVAGCFLSMRGLQQALTERLGFEPDELATARFDPASAAYSEADGRSLQQRTIEVLGRLPGVTAAAYANSLPLAVDQSTTTVYPDRLTDVRPSEIRRAFHYQVSPGFLRILGVRFVAGRDIDGRDTPDVPLVAVVNHAFAEQVFSTRDAIGMRFRFGPSAPAVRVVGIVETGKYQSVMEADQPAVFQSALQSYNSSTVVLVRSLVPAEQTAAVMQRAFAALAPEVPVEDAGHVMRLLGFALLPSRAAAIALTAFGGLALILAMTGVHGLVAYAVRKREHELAVRVALGAGRVEIVRLVVARVALLLALGAAAGVLLASALGGVFANVVYEVSPGDPAVLASVVLAMLMASGVACWIPARRLLRIDPMVALRAE